MSFSVQFIQFSCSVASNSLRPHETYITICKIDRKRDFAVCLRKLQQGLCINLEGWDGEGDGKEAQKGGDICLPMADSC